MVNIMFVKQIGRNIKVYVNDMWWKVGSPPHTSLDLIKAFEVLQHYQMNLNLEKCTFSVSSSKFLSFMVNPHKIWDVLEIKPPKSLKQLQRLNGRIAMLNRFVFRSTDKCLPFFKVLRKRERLDLWVSTGIRPAETVSQLSSLLAKPVHGD